VYNYELFDHIAWVEESDELLLVNHANEKAIVLKNAGKEIVGLMLEKITTVKLVSLLSDKYKVPFTEMEKDVIHFSEELHEAGFVERIVL